MISLKTEDLGVAADFWHWWWSELPGVRSMKGRRAGSREQLPTIHVSRDGYRLIPSGESSSLENVAAALVRLKSSGRVKSSGIEIRLSRDRYIERAFAAIRLPRSTALNMAQFDVEAATPFRPGDVLTCLESDARTSGARRYFLIKKAIVDPLHSCFRKCGFRIASAYIETADGWLEIDGFHKNHPVKWRGVATTLSVVTAIFLSTLSVAFVWSAARTANRIIQKDVALISSRLEQLKPEFQNQRKVESLVRELRTRREEASGMTAILDALTANLPDGTYLEKLVVENRSIALAGYSSDAPPLIAKLEASPFFQGVTFSSPTGKVPGKDGTHFEIGMKAER